MSSKLLPNLLQNAPKWHPGAPRDGLLAPFGHQGVKISKCWSFWRSFLNKMTSHWALKSLKIHKKSRQKPHWTRLRKNIKKVTKTGWALPCKTSIFHLFFYVFEWFSGSLKSRQNDSKIPLFSHFWAPKRPKSASRGHLKNTSKKHIEHMRFLGLSCAELQPMTCKPGSARDRKAHLQLRAHHDKAELEVTAIITSTMFPQG